MRPSVPPPTASPRDIKPNPVIWTIRCRHRGVMLTSSERRPFIKLRKDGGAYILVHRKGRGMRARQITPRGWQWITEKYPHAAYPNPESIPLTYADYWTLQKQGDIHIERRKRSLQPRGSNRRQPVNEVRLSGGSHGDTPAAHYTPPTREIYRFAETVRTASATASDSEKCLGCGTDLKDDACFCPRCGRVTRYAAANGLPLTASRTAPASTSRTEQSPVPPAAHWRVKFAICQIIVIAVAYIAWLCWSAFQ